MSKVYGRSALNIAATGAVNGSQGLFFDRTPPWLRRYELAVNVRGSNMALECKDAYTYHRCIGSQPLSSRGWAVQDRVLSPRTLHFSKTEVFWECKNGNASKTSREPFLYHPAAGDDFLRKDSSLSWDIIVQLYTTANLTYNRDKLIAMADFARNYQRRTRKYTAKNTYLAGLWQEHLEATLYWYVEASRPRPTIYTAPIWSWASVDGRIRTSKGWYHREVSEKSIETIDVVHVAVTHSTDDEFGEVSGATLMLGCRILTPGHASVLMSGICTVKAVIRSLKIRIMWDTKEMESTTVGRHCFVANNNSARDSVGGGLVLKQLLDRTGQYRRAGHFVTVFKDPRKHVCDLEGHSWKELRNVVGLRVMITLTNRRALVNR